MLAHIIPSAVLILASRHFHTVRESFEESLKALDVEYIDLYLIHWPQTHENGR